MLNNFNLIRILIYKVKELKLISIYLNIYDIYFNIELFLKIL